MRYALAAVARAQVLTAEPLQRHTRDLVKGVAVQNQQGIADLAPTGTLRVAVILGNPVLATRDPSTGELCGIVIDLGQELAGRSGVPFVPVIYPTRLAVFEGLRDSQWDVVFMAIDPERASDLDFSPPYMEVDTTYLVAADSSIENVAAADRPGVRIAVGRANAADLFLTRALRYGELVRGNDDAHACELFLAGEADVLAGSRSALVACADGRPDVRILIDSLYVVPHAIAVPRGRGSALAQITAFVETVRASGIVAQAIERAGLRGVRVARES